MLAEPRRKVKWTLNPRGNYWAEDESNYGQKMLRKMGWEKGKGLGKNEDGNTDHIKVIYKNDKKGVGAKGYDDDWIAHQDDFDSVLSSLNEQFSPPALPMELKEPALESLEKKSKSSRSRVHYHKFTRGKDITRYSSKDMAAIFGNKKKDEEEQKDEESSHEDQKEDCSTQSSLITYNSGQSVQEYFKQKMAQKKKADDQGSCMNISSGEDKLISSSDSKQSDPKPTEENLLDNKLKKRKKHKKEKKKRKLDTDVLSKRKRNKTVILNHSNLSSHKSKESRRCNALEQMKLYSDVFPNRQTLPTLEKYEALCENFKSSGLASSNLLSVPGYGNYLLLKE